MRTIGPPSSSLRLTRYWIRFGDIRTQAGRPEASRLRRMTSLLGLDLRYQAHHAAPLLRLHRQRVDDVGTVVASLAVIPRQFRGRRVASGSRALDYFA